MTYAPSPRDFDLSPRNRYAAMRMGVTQPVNRPDATSDLHRLSNRMVGVTVVAAITVVVGLLLPAAFETVGNAAAIYDILSPAAP